MKLGDQRVAEVERTHVRQAAPAEVAPVGYAWRSPLTGYVIGRVCRSEADVDAIINPIGKLCEKVEIVALYPQPAPAAIPEVFRELVDAVQMEFCGDLTEV